MLLFDENLSRRLARSLAQEFPGCVHVSDRGLLSADDGLVWEHARAAGLAIVSKDADFVARLVLFGTPPKVVIVRSGNCTTSQVEQLLRSHSEQIRSFCERPEASVLLLS
jgi:predicted nuclease of predicted toxin-antitoxin system